MKISRRSFLAAIGGAIVASKAAHDSAPSRFIPYVVWDTARVEPNQSFEDVRLLPPPTPESFIIESIGVHVDAEHYATVAELLRKVDLELRTETLTWLRGGLAVFPPLQTLGPEPEWMRPSLLPQPIRTLRNDGLGIYLKPGLDLVPSEPATITVSLRGFCEVEAA